MPVRYRALLCVTVPSAISKYFSLFAIHEARSGLYTMAIVLGAELTMSSEQACSWEQVGRRRASVAAASAAGGMHTERN